MATNEVDQSHIETIEAKSPKAPTAEQRARAERNRLRARELKEQRLNSRRAPSPPSHPSEGGGFIPEASAAEPARAAAARLAPVADPAERPHCAHCGRPFAHSYLLETFGFAACDACRDDEGAHALMTRTEAKSEYLLQDCDLDSRPPPLRCVRRRNPHAPRGDMRLYLRAQLEERALLVWGSEEALEEEAARRRAAQEAARRRREDKRLRALRMDVRSTLFRRGRAAHEHAFGAESYDAAADVYERVCAECGHRETYEKM